MIDPPETKEPVQVPFLLKLSIAGRAIGVVVLGLYPKRPVMAALRVASTLF